MRQEEEDILENDRSILVTRVLRIMTLEGKLPEIAGSLDFRSRLLQKCIEFCTQTERVAVFKELKPHFLSLACNVFAVRLVTRMVYYRKSRYDKTEPQKERILPTASEHHPSYLLLARGFSVDGHYSHQQIAYCRLLEKETKL